MWQIFEFLIHEKYLLVKQLVIHLPREKPVYFEEANIIEELEERMNKARSTLIVFFNYN